VWESADRVLESFHKSIDAWSWLQICVEQGIPVCVLGSLEHINKLAGVASLLGHISSPCGILDVSDYAVAFYSCFNHLKILALKILLFAKLI
jgi:hypothetical protein